MTISTRFTSLAKIRCRSHFDDGVGWIRRRTRPRGGFGFGWVSAVLFCTKFQKIPAGALAATSLFDPTKLNQASTFGNSHSKK